MCPGHTKSSLTTYKYKILTVHNLYFYSVLTSIFSSLYSCPPQPIVDQVKPHLSKRKEVYFILFLVRLPNHLKNMPYVGLKLWNSFINVILKFRISGSCDAQTHAFFTHFLQIFFDNFFLLAKLFSHISCKNALKPYRILHPPYPKILFRSRHGGKILGNSQQWAKIKIIGENGGQILGGGVDV